METNNHKAFGIWVTGLPASGKSTLTAALKEQLRSRGVDAAVLESDTLRVRMVPHGDTRQAQVASMTSPDRW